MPGASRAGSERYSACPLAESRGRSARMVMDGRSRTSLWDLKGHKWAESIVIELDCSY